MNHIFCGYIRPFTRKGFIPFIISFALALIPFVQLLVPAIAYSDSPTLRSGGLGRLVMLSLKMFLVTLMLLAPSIALYLLAHILGAMLMIGPDWLLYILLGMTLFLAVSALVLMPMALAVLSRGRSIREALDGQSVKLLISAGFGRYVACLVCLIPVVFLAFFIDLLPLWMAYIYSAFLTALALSYLGYVMNHCYDKAAPALGLPAGAASAVVGGGVRYARSVLSMLLVVALLGQFGSALAFNEDEELASGNYPKNQYTAEEYNAALEKFMRNGQLNENTKIYFDTDTGNFYCAAKPGTNEAFEAVGGFIGDCLPGLSTVKNTLEFIQYKKIADDPSRSDAERAAARRMQYLKFVTATFTFAGPIGKAASMVTGKGVIPFLIVKAGTAVTDPTFAAIISAADDAVWGWELVGNTYKIVKLVDEDVGDAFAPYAPENVLGVPSPSPSVPAGANVQPGSEASEGPENTIPEGNYAAFWGTYKGTLVCPNNTMDAYGVTGSFSNPEMTITLDKEGYMSLNYTFDSAYEYDSSYGASMSGTTSMPIDIKNVSLTRTMAGYMGDYTSGGFVATTVTQYSGEGYEDGGGDMTTTAEYKISFSIIISMVNVNGKIQTIASGTVTQTPLGGNDSYTQSLVMSFDITKAA